jgi:hypothetical protein
MKRIKTKFIDFVNEISSDTFKSAIDISKKNGTDGRTRILGKLYFDKFIGKDLLGGKITYIEVINPSQGNYKQVNIEIEKEKVIDTGYNAGKTKMVKDYIQYDIDKDSYSELNEIERKDAVILSNIAKHINPETKYKEVTKHFKIKGW